MKGFLKRDFFLLLGSGKFYLCFIGVMVILTAFTDLDVSFLFLYVTIFGASSAMSLFNYDEINHWGAYAAALPKGRAAQVSARYLICLGVMLASGAIMVAVALFAKGEEQLVMAACCAILGFFYVAFFCPIQYRFGNRARLVMLIFIAAVAGGAAFILGFEGPETAAIESAVAPALPFLLLGGGVVLAGSYALSRHIVAEKEFT